MSQQDFLEYMNSLGFGGGSLNFEDLSSLTNPNTMDTVAYTMEDLYGIQAGFLNPTMFNPLSSTALDSSNLGFYSNLIQQGQDTSLSDYFQRMTSPTYRKSFGGAAQSGYSGMLDEEGKDLYKKQGTDILTDVFGRQLSSINELFNQVQSWQETAFPFSEQV